jgi:hypothetical protein
MAIRLLINSWIKVIGTRDNKVNIFELIFKHFR